MKFVVKRKDEDSVEPAYLTNLTTMSTKKGCLTCDFCPKNDPGIFHTDDINIAAGLAIAIGGKIETT